jgi:predicted GIY-YIG superfamily endonuclease
LRWTAYDPGQNNVPFQNISARPFKAAVIRREAPASSGVYGLSNAREWIYVGETGDIQGRLLDHLERMSDFLADALPTGFSFELCAAHERAARQRHLILELRPVRNPQMKRGAGSANREVLNSAREDY